MEIRLQQPYQRRVEAVEPHHVLAAVFMIMPGPAWGGNKVAFADLKRFALDDETGTLAF
jgi:hypothetical protein